MSNEPQLQNDLPAGEPSVLDYLKSKLKFWEHGEKIDIPVTPESLAENARPRQEIDAAGKSPEEPARSYPWPWRALLAMVFALLGQRAFEPGPTRSAATGLLLYGLGLALLVWACLKKEWNLAPAPQPGSTADPMTARRLPLLLAILCSGLAFFFMKGNLFTSFNLLLWVFAIVFFIMAFWLPREQREPFWPRLKAFFARESWQFNVTRWSLLVLGVVAVVVFFRVYNLGSVPSEPFSDHAEKILDVYDITQGQTHIFFPRNTGREAIQMYLTAAVAWLFGTGLSFLSLKLGTVICGLATLPYLYLLGKEIGGKRVGLLAVLFAGIAYWPNVISRAGLRFPLYPLFVAPTLLYLVRGLRTRNRNDFILSGLFLGLGLHGYSPFRIMPFVVVIAVGLYLLHAQSKGIRKQAVIWLAILALASLVIFLPLARYWMENPESFSNRAFSRLGDPSNPLPAPVWQIFLSNTGKALRMFNWDDGEIWVHSVTHRPALDVVSGALFIIGIVLVLIRYIRQRHWLDLFLLLAIPLLQLPSILSLAYPAENPALNRAGGALVPTFLLVALALDGLFTEIRTRLGRQSGVLLTRGLALFLMLWSSAQNFGLVFNQYANQFSGGAWNSSEMGAVIQQFDITYGTTDSVWIVPYPYWVDTRLPGVWAGIPNRDFAVWPADLATTLDTNGTKLFIVNTQDTATEDQLDVLYPNGVWSRFVSKTGLEGKDFMIFLVPSEGQSR